MIAIPYDSASPLEWRKGAPPHVGWWLAGYERLRNVWRWWDGRQWSRPAYDHQPAQHAAICALRRDDKQDAILWSHYYPEGARVPRITP